MLKHNRAMAKVAAPKWNLLAIPGAIALLVGGFSLVFAFPALATGVWRIYRDHRVESRWIETDAKIEKRWLSVHTYHALSSDKAYIFGDEYSLRCRLRYEFSQHQHVFDLDTLSDSSLDTRAAIENWIEAHRPGAILHAKVNPSNPDEIAVVSELPIQQSGTARQALRVGFFCGVGGALLLVIARVLLRFTPTP